MLVAFCPQKKCLELTAEGKLAQRIVCLTSTHMWMEGAFEHQGDSEHLADREGLSLVATLVNQLTSTVVRQLGACLEELGAELPLTYVFTRSAVHATASWP